MFLRHFSLRFVVWTFYIESQIWNTEIKKMSPKLGRVIFLLRILYIIILYISILLLLYTYSLAPPLTWSHVQIAIEQWPTGMSSSCNLQSHLRIIRFANRFRFCKQSCLLHATRHRAQYSCVKTDRYAVLPVLAYYMIHTCRRLGIKRNLLYT